MDCELKFKDQLSAMLLKALLSASVIVSLIMVSSIGFAQTNETDSAGLLENGQAKEIITPKSSDEIKVISYNIRWRSGAELQQITRWLKDSTGSGPAIIGLQEVDRAKQRTGRINHAKAIADALGMYYAWAAPSGPAGGKKSEEETGVEILSSYPLTDISRIVLPNPGPGARQRVAIAATITIWKSSVRVYSVHSETRLTIARKVDQWRAVLTDLDRFPKGTPAVVLGDFNTWELPAVEGVRKLFTDAGFTTALPGDESTFYRKALMFDVKLKLDWIWLRGLSAQKYGIDRSLTVSDHFPLWTTATIGEAGITARTAGDTPQRVSTTCVSG